MQVEMSHLSLTESKLRETIEWLTEENGVSMEPDMQCDLQSIMEEKSDEIQNIPRKLPSAYFLGAATKCIANERQMPDTLALCNQWCLHVKFKFSGTYHALRSIGVLTCTTLRKDYTHLVKGGVGFRADVNEQLMEEANNQKEMDKYTVLVFDELKVREDLVFSKH